jgi:hypothetical protein
MQFLAFDRKIWNEKVRMKKLILYLLFLLLISFCTKNPTEIQPVTISDTLFTDWGTFYTTPEDKRQIDTVKVRYAFNGSIVSSEVVNLSSYKKLRFSFIAAQHPVSLKLSLFVYHKPVIVFLDSIFTEPSKIEQVKFECTDTTKLKDGFLGVGIERGIDGRRGTVTFRKLLVIADKK